MCISYFCLPTGLGLILGLLHSAPKQVVFQKIKESGAETLHMVLKISDTFWIQELRLIHMDLAIESSQSESGPFVIDNYFW